MSILVGAVAGPHAVHGVTARAAARAN
jgi:hypothetical protein